MRILKEYESCTLCARACKIDRTKSSGACGVGSELLVSRAALHPWEEPIISGTRGSGTIFFSGCSLGCIFCQNREISGGKVGTPLTTERLAEIMLSLEKQGAHNINLVTPTHYTPHIKKAIILAKSHGMSLPIVYNTGGYDSIENLRSLSGLVDIYLPDLKYHLPKTAKAYSHAENYPEAARAAIDEMVRQRGEPVIGDDGVMKSGVIVRILLLPSHLAEAKLTVKYLYSRYKDSVYISLMSQYTPMPGMPPPLDRTATRSEYRELTEYAASLGVTRCFVQGEGAATDAYIPSFDGTGVVK